jgi:methionyl-tRNA formyltransferase
VYSLECLLNAGYDLAAVVTAPDKPAGRGMELQESAIKKFAISKGLKILQPIKLKDPDFIQSLQELKADLFVVVAFRMLPEMVWNMPPMGTINVHASLLPQYRGAAPINWAIINGEHTTGVTTFKLKHEIDTGNILLSTRVPITEKEDAGSLHDKLMKEGGHLLVETLKRLESGTLKETEQDAVEEKERHHAPKIHAETCRIDWKQPAEKIHNLIRGLSPYPAAFTTFDGKKMKIFSSSIQKNVAKAVPGSIITDNKTFLRFATTDGMLDIHELQWEGRKRMSTTDFLRGYRPGQS